MGWERAADSGGFSLYQLNLLCQYSYGVGRGDERTLVGRHDFHDERLGAYWVLDSLFSPSNGFEGLVAAPDDGRERPDGAHVTVVFAGTNLEDDARHDLWATPGTFILPAGNPFCQAKEARTLLGQARRQALELGHPEAEPVLTGHSLGGGLALLLAIRNGLQARVFCAVDPWRVLDRRERRAAAEACADGRLVDYRLSNDRLTGPLNHLLSGRDNRCARVVWCGQGQDLLGHWLSGFSFDGSGALMTGQAPAGWAQRLSDRRKRLAAWRPHRPISPWVPVLRAIQLARQLVRDWIRLLPWATAGKV
ncbi:lipase family protein [Bifidobacterium xylocopae]|nr:hypothetical protein [Bifidobacterium xylocopae]